jgi:pyridoxamine 5'-phosphate oxidase
MAENTDFIPPADPWHLFKEWYALAEKAEPSDPNAMALATLGAGGMPSVRIVLLKDFNESGFVFYTNRESNKGRELEKTPIAGLNFHWKSLRRQVRAEGPVVPVSEAESDAYFATRPRGSQIGAWASQQSRVLESRAMLEQHVQEIEKKYEGREVPRPPYWGGYRLVPRIVEFWQERIYRLHDRIVYRQANDKTVWTDDRIVYQSRDNGAWTIERLYP